MFIMVFNVKEHASQFHEILYYELYFGSNWPVNINLYDYWLGSLRIFYSTRDKEWWQNGTEALQGVDVGLMTIMKYKS